MSDDDEVQYIKKQKTIHYGSLEDAERARLEAQGETSNDSEPPATSAAPQVQESSGWYTKTKMFEF